MFAAQWTNTVIHFHYGYHKCVILKLHVCKGKLKQGRTNVNRTYVGSKLNTVTRMRRHNGCIDLGQRNV